MSRDGLAQDIAAGLSGWLQLQIVQGLGNLSGEDTARLITAQIINSQGRYRPRISSQPINWVGSKKRIDIALLSAKEDSRTWYGAIEIKWPGTNVDVSKTRTEIVQDMVRLTFIDTNQLNAHFLVLGGSYDAMNLLFDHEHKTKTEKDEQRKCFKALLSRTIKHPEGEVVHSQWIMRFPEAGNRVPEKVFGNFDGKFKTKLLAKSSARVGQNREGLVYVWQCNRTRGTQAQD